MHYQRAAAGRPLDQPQRVKNAGAICTVDGCGRDAHIKLLCQLHYHRLRQSGETGPAGLVVSRGVEVCSIEGCGRPYSCGGYCVMHYHRVLKNGDPGDVSPHKVYGKPIGTSRVHRGYREVKVAETGAKNWRKEHSLIMEAHLGRPLERYESVHHKNGDRLDNRLCNLELWSSAQPAGQRVIDRVAWAKQILATYEPDALADGARKERTPEGSQTLPLRPAPH